MKFWHPILADQIERNLRLPEPLPADWRQFLEDINESYWRLCAEHGSMEQRLAANNEERSRTEEALRASEFFLQKSQRVANLGSYYFDTRTGRWMSSPALDEVLGIDQEFVRNVAGWLSLVHPADRESMGRYFGEYVLAGRNRFDREYRIVRGCDQVERWVHGLGELEFDDRGQVTKMIGTIQDITERKQNEQALRALQEQLTATLNALPDLLFVVDRQECIRDYRAGRKDLLHVKPEAFLNQPVSSVLPRETAQLVSMGIQEAFVMGVSREIVYQLPTPHGMAWFEMRAARQGDALDEGAMVTVLARDITDRKTAEDRLRQNEQLLRSVLQISGIGVFEHDHVADVLHLSPELRKSRGFALDEVVNPGEFFQSIHPDDCRRVQEAVQRSHDPRGDGRYQSEHRYYHRDGSVRWFVASAQTFFAGEGSMRHKVRTVGAILDVTKDRETARVLRENEERLRLALEASDLGFFDLNVRTGEMLVNPQYALMLGYDPASFRESMAQWRDRLHPEDREPVYRAHAEYLAGLRSEYRMEFRQRTRDGRWIWVLSLGKVVSRDASGGPLRLLGTRSEITARKETERRARQLNRTYAVMSDINQLIVREREPEAILSGACRIAVERGCFRLAWVGMLDPVSGRVRPAALAGQVDGYFDEVKIEPPESQPYESPTATALFHGRREVVNNIEEDPRASGWRAAALKRGFLSAASFPLEMEGRVIGAFSLYSSEPDLFDDEELKLLGSLVTDIAFALQSCEHEKRRRSAEAQLEQALDNLELKVRQRTEELQLAKDAAETASRAKSEFLAMMSHEIRTPLGGVIGVLRLLSQTPLNTKQQRHIEMASTSAVTLLRVINDVLDFSKVEAGKLDLEHTTFDLPQTVESIAGVFHAGAAAKNIALTVRVAPGVPRLVRGDSSRVGQILMNLIGNALKFTETGEVRVELSALPASATRSPVRCQIVDTGIGIPLDRQQNLFRPFYQVDSSTRRRYGGTGLGLGICRQLVSLMDGSIGLTSQPGEGATFWFEIPFERVADEAWPAGGSGGASPRGARTSPVVAAHQQPRVLVADDNEINQELAREMIEATGCQCDCVTNGQAAVRAALEGRYEIIFMDCMMPDMDGFEATQKIRAEEHRRALHGQLRRTPIIAMTANAMKGDREACLAAGMDDYLGKPLQPEAVHDMVTKWLPVSQASMEWKPAPEGREPGGEEGAAEAAISGA